VFLVSLSFAVPAQADFSIQVVPAQVELTLKQGSETDLWVSATNHGIDPIDLTVTVHDFARSLSGAFETLEPGHATYSAGRWIDLPVEALRLAPGETSIIDYTLTVPHDAEPGGHYAAIIFKAIPVESESAGEGSQVRIAGRVVAEVLITVPGPITRNLVVDSLTVPRIAFGAGADYADVTVRNTGNVHLTPNGYVQTWGGLPAVSFDQEFGQFTVLPGGSRHFRVPLENLPWLGRMKAKTELKYGPSIGVFDRSVETAVDYFVVSWKVILILDLLLIGFDLVLLREWRQRVAARRATPVAAQDAARGAAQDTAS
jgi:hypothetical protein